MLEKANSDVLATFSRNKKKNCKDFYLSLPENFKYSFIKYNLKTIVIEIAYNASYGNYDFKYSSLYNDSNTLEEYVLKLCRIGCYEYIYDLIFNSY